MIKNIIFDFDGVILDSVNIKTEAFYKLFEQYGSKIANQVVDYHIINGGMSRFKKFEYYGKYLIKYNFNKNELKSLSDKFDQLINEKISKANFIVGAEEFLIRYNNIYNFFISTGTPQENINEIIKIRNLSYLFKKVYGTPKSKEKHIKEILLNSNDSKCEYLFVGDSKNDYDAAHKMGILFIGVGNNDFFKKIKINVINDLTYLKEALNKLESVNE
jgi:HAD superfamily hydrolase (TIGR01549 family)|tara:strand:- start:5294 stop:5944 length:651 start_codon:yes stop_codon:yes gene_type:complete